MFPDAVPFAFCRASFMTAEQIVLVRYGRHVEMQLRGRIGSFRSIVLRRRD